MLAKYLSIRARRLRRNENGAAQVEFIVSIMVILFTMFLMWELLMAIYTASVLADAAKEGVRYAIVHGSNSTICSGPTCAGDASADRVKSAVHDYAVASLHDISAIDIEVTYPDTTNDPPNRVEVAVTYNYVPYISLSGLRPTMTTRAAGRIVH